MSIGNTHWVAGRRTWLTGLLALALFGGPLFIGLGRWDFKGDEPIYSYAVDRMVQVRDWITPRSIPDDTPFLEKPPLKFWIVAGAMRAGLLPRDEFGMRFFDAVFGLAAFAYIFALASRVAGPWTGWLALLLLFSLDPLIFEHGLRSNNMEAALFLSYCGGIYHFSRWAELEADRTRRRRHAYAVAGFAVLGFMTKFVAIAFLPMVAGAAFLTRPKGWSTLRATWADWVMPLVVALAASAPWFVAQSIERGRAFWAVIFGAHVYQRFTASLDPAHVHPWWYYFTQTWREFSLAGSVWVIAAGVIWLAWRALLPGREWMARLLVAWWLVPFALMSVGTSKLFHYAYPFLPPLAIAAAWLIVETLRLADRRITAPLSQWEATQRAAGRGPGVRWSAILIVLGLLAAIVLSATLIVGRFGLTLGGVRLFSNSSIVRPLLVAGVCAALLRRVGILFRGVVPLLVVFVLLPGGRYPRIIDRTLTVAQPLHVLKACMLDAQIAGATRSGIYTTQAELSYAYYYYLRMTGHWRISTTDVLSEGRIRLVDPATQSPMIVRHSDLASLRQSLGPAAGLSTSQTPRLQMEPDAILLLPGPYAACAGKVIAAGAQPMPESE